MPKGPKGERRPADAAQCAHKVFRIAVGEETDAVPSGRRQSGIAGAAARSGALSSDRRREIAQKAASTRWKRQHTDGDTEMAKAAVGGHSDSDRGQEFSRYPNNTLGPQVRDYRKVPNLHDLVKEHFLKEKAAK